LVFLTGTREASGHNEHENFSNNNALAGVSYKKKTIIRR
jgi:hypothetical protein